MEPWLALGDVVPVDTGSWGLLWSASSRELGVSINRAIAIVLVFLVVRVKEATGLGKGESVPRPQCSPQHGFCRVHPMQ